MRDDRRCARAAGPHGPGRHPGPGGPRHRGGEPDRGRDRGHQAARHVRLRRAPGPPEGAADDRDHLHHRARLARDRDPGDQRARLRLSGEAVRDEPPAHDRRAGGPEAAPRPGPARLRGAVPLRDREHRRRGVPARAGRADRHGKRPGRADQRVHAGGARRPVHVLPAARGGRPGSGGPPERGARGRGRVAVLRGRGRSQGRHAHPGRGAHDQRHEGRRPGRPAGSGPRHHGAPQPGGSAPPGPEDGGHRPARGRRGPRLQQPADRHRGPLLPRAQRADLGEPDPARDRDHPGRRRARGQAHASTAGLQPQADPGAARARSERHRDRHRAAAATHDPRGHRDRDRARSGRGPRQGRRRADRASLAQPGRQRERRHAARGPADDDDRAT